MKFLTLLLVNLHISLIHGEISKWYEFEHNATVRYNIYGALDEYSVSVINSALEEIKTLTTINAKLCVGFIKQTKTPYIDFEYSRSGQCVYPSNIGMPVFGNNNLKIPFVVNPNCINKVALVYHLARIIGLQDEHTRPDRDNYITVHWQNIKTPHRPGIFNISNALKQKPYTNGDTNYGDYKKDYPYDFLSITHFGPFEHAKDKRKPTISSKYRGVYFGDQSSLSFTDIRKIQNLYNCKQDTTNANVWTMGIQEQIRCNFDLPVCNMVNDWRTSGISKWELTAGPITEDGPQTDHSNGNGTYMYLNGTTINKVARMISLVEITKTVCVSFYYYIHGDVNSTSLKALQQDSLTDNSTFIMELGDTDCESWAFFNKTINTPKNQSWRLVLQANAFQGGVAVDDVVVANNACKANPCRMKNCDVCRYFNKSYP